MLHEWLEEDPDFFTLHYLGRHRPSIMHNEFVDIKTRIASNPLEVKSHIYSDINKERETSGKKSKTKPIFYRTVKQTHTDTEYPWFSSNHIKLPSIYSVRNERDSLSTVFTYSDLKTYG